MQFRLLGSVIATLWVLGLPGCGDEDDSAHPAGIGNHCAADDDCPTRNCYLGPGGGYCTSVCSNEGSTSECPTDTVCKPIQGGPARCLLICGSDSSCGIDKSCGEAHCPSGSACVSVSDTSVRACEPNPG